LDRLHRSCRKEPPAFILLPQAYPTDLTDSAAVKAAIAAVHSDLGPIDLLFWNPVSTPAPLLTATPEQLGAAYDVTVTGV
jgi:3-oxoacyl-[acyl-carrier protein] reductase